MSKIYQDLEQIKLTLDVFARMNGLFEIRSIGGKTISSGYFVDYDAILKTVEKTRETWYFAMNEIDIGCYSRDQRDKIIQNPKATTKDSDIIGRNWILIDCDPKRPTGVSATDTEKESAHKTAQRVYKWLRTQGFEEPVIADSGNGYHLIYRVQAENSPEIAEIIKNLLKVLDMYFSDGKTGIDTAVFNAARVTKLYGTLAQKGQDTQERPHRMSKIIHIPNAINMTGLNYITRVADMLPKPEPYGQRPFVYNGTQYGGRQFDLRDFIANNGIRVSREINYGDGVKFLLEECPFDSSHTSPDSAIFLRNDGIIGFKCFHSSCSNYTWRDLRLKFEPDAYDDKSRTNGQKYINDKPIPNYRKKEYKPLDFEEIKANAPKIAGTNEPQPIFLTTEQIRSKPNQHYEYIPTGIIDFDRRNRGFCKGKITCLSGETGCGKSSLVSLFMLEAVQNGYKTALFSGELEDKDAYNWLILQAAGKRYIRPTQYENFYIPNEESEELISQWLNEKIYIYNNDYGNQFEFISGQLSEITHDKKVDLIILDNLMSMDIESLSDETNKQQTVFVQQLKKFAKMNNVHIVFVAHPRKPDKKNLIDKYDVCGSSNIVNMVDNILIIYRTLGKYYTLKGSEFKVNTAEIDEAVGSELRICKDRSGGEMDRFVPLYFEKESKRLKNSAEEIKLYGWQGQEHKLEIIDAADDIDLPADWK
jgi:archaellum biogenesis ATPase FlaH